MSKVYIVTPNFGYEFVTKYFSSLMSQTYNDFKIIFIDNTINGNAEFYTPVNSNLILIQNTENKKFATTMNQGINIALEDEECQYIIALNNDIVAEKDFVKNLLETANRHKDAGSVQSLMLYGDTGKIDNTGLLYSKNGLCFGRDANRIYDPQEHYLEQEILGACAGACLYRASALRTIMNKTEIFDEKIEAYYDDLDVALRLQSKGWKCYYNPHSVVKHYKNVTLNKNKVYYACRNSMYVYNKCLSRNYRKSNRLWFWMGNILQVTYYLLRGYPIVFKAKWDAYKLLKNHVQHDIVIEDISKWMVLKWK